MDPVEIVVAHSERATLRVGDTFLKVDGDDERLRHEAELMAAAPVPTPRILWMRDHVVAMSALDGAPLGRLGEPMTASAAAWVATGTVIRILHEAPPPQRSAQQPAELTVALDDECAWLVDNGLLPAELVMHNRRVADAALRPWTPAFIHGDLQIAHVFIDDDQVTGILDWSEASAGDPLYDLAILTLGHPDRLDDLLVGYDSPVDRDVIRGWWSARSLLAARWLIEHGFDPDSPGCEFDVLRSALR
ncbi:aminoglycoside phosphotransferase family protein [Flexivirga caeni]|uniref:Aminoglycoside phosphotransferase family protein n=1 Tax=Flexivirga caeni TaxID=2294115 RepID=A0A3M9LV66_9MICO|nr:aminoglycoside phosphotransferase family protein [Flexivirga caeni]